MMQKKLEFMEKEKANRATGDILFPDRLRSAVQKLVSLPNSGLANLSYNSLKIRQKIPDDFLFLRQKIEDNVTRYFETLRQAFSDYDGENNCFQSLQKSVREMFINIEQTSLNLSEIFNLMSTKISAQINEDIIVGEIIVSFFVQTCEVFNEISQ